MSESAPPPPAPTPMTDYALARLRKLADGNGLAPESIRLLGTDEKTYTLNGTMSFEPIVETTPAHYIGPVKGKDRQTVADPTALKSEVEKKSEEMRAKTDWFPAVMATLQEQDGHGWGQDDAKITPPAPTPTILAATSPCSQCRGQKVQTCPACQGQGVGGCPACHGNRYEVCPQCYGQGVNPSDHSQKCSFCSNYNTVINAMTHVPCHACQGQGQAACPTCHGQRSIPCPACKGGGLITEEVTLTLIIRTHFQFSGIELPSGLLRGIDRIGVVNLPKGHTDISIIPPKPPTEKTAESSTAPPDFYEEDDPEAKATPQKSVPDLSYEAQIPYAELRMDFNGRKARVSVFGKRRAMMGVPPFLDDALEDVLQRLREASKKRGDLAALMQTRIFYDALKLIVTGHGDAKSLRRIYPFGLSPKVTDEILRDLRGALARLTLAVRVMIGAASVILSVLLFGGAFLTPAHGFLLALLPHGWADLLPLILALTGGWSAQGLASRFVLAKHIPTLTIPLRAAPGRVGYAVSVGVFIAFAAILWRAPQKPEWLGWIIGRF